MNVIVIDDNIVNRKLLTTYVKKIENIGEIYEADDGDVGLKKILENKDNLSLILLDLYMPKMTGFEVIEKLKNENIDIPIIVLSTDDSVEEEILLQGINFIQKPVKQQQLLEEINLTINTKE